MKYADLLAPYVSVIEGPNEVNAYTFKYTTPSGTVLLDRAGAVAFQKDLFAAVNSDPLLKDHTAVASFSLAPGRSFSGYGNISAYTDYTNVHAYGQLGIPPPFYLRQEIEAVTLAPSRPYLVSETGNYTDPSSSTGVNEVVQAKLLMEVLLDDFKAGVKSTYLYELLDSTSDPNYQHTEEHYGLFNFDGSPKKVATAIRNLSSILGESTANAQSFATTPLAFSVTNLPKTGQYMTLQKSDGSYDIALWQEPWIWRYATPSAPVGSEILFPSTTVTVSLGKVYQTINLYDPLSGSTPVKTYHNVSSVNVALNTGALILEVVANSSVPVIPTTYTGAAGGVFAIAGAEKVITDSGAVTVNGAGAVTVLGATGSLSVNLTGSAASVSGGAGALTVTDSADSDANTIVGGEGTFTYSGDGDGDTITTGTSGRDTVSLGAGRDTVTVLAATTLTGGAGAATVTLNGSGSLVTGGAGALNVTDNGGGNSVIGGTGALTYTDVAGDDVVVTGTSGQDQVNLGSGRDSVTVLAATTVTGGSGSATVTLYGGGSTVLGDTGTLTITDLSAGGDTITGGAGAVTVKAALGGEAITTNNTSGVSSISLGTGSNTVTVNGATYINADKSDLAVIGNANLSINGGTGALTLTGIKGNEYVFTQGGTSSLLNLGSGKNTVLSHGSDTINASTVAGAGATGVYAAGAATVTGGAGVLYVNGQNSAISVTGGTGLVKASAMGDGSYLKGGSLGGNILSASGSNTTLVGGGGGLLSDTGSGNNLLIAGSGATTLIAGSGNDTLVGGSGADVFVLTQADAGHSTMIQNFKAGTDTLSFVGFDGTPIASQQVTGGNLKLILGDQTQVTLMGVTSLG